MERGRYVNELWASELAIVAPLDFAGAKSMISVILVYKIVVKTLLLCFLPEMSNFVVYPMLSQHQSELCLVVPNYRADCLQSYYVNCVFINLLQHAAN